MSGRIRQAPSGEIVTDWKKNHKPTANTQATIAQPAAGVNVRNVLTALSVTLVAGTTAPAAAVVNVAVIDGATGGTTYLWGPLPLGVTATAGATNGIALGGLWIQGTPNTAMTIEFDGAAGANTFEAVWMSGTTEPA